MDNEEQIETDNEELKLEFSENTHRHIFCTTAFYSSSNTELDVRLEIESIKPANMTDEDYNKFVEEKFLPTVVKDASKFYLDDSFEL